MKVMRSAAAKRTAKLRVTIFETGFSARTAIRQKASPAMTAK